MQGSIALLGLRLGRYSLHFGRFNTSEGAQCLNLRFLQRLAAFSEPGGTGKAVCGIVAPASRLSRLFKASRQDYEGRAVNLARVVMLVGGRGSWLGLELCDVITLRFQVYCCKLSDLRSRFVSWLMYPPFLSCPPSSSETFDGFFVFSFPSAPWGAKILYTLPTIQGQQ